MNELTFCIYGNPIPLQRHRTTVRNGIGIAYDSQALQKKMMKRLLIAKIKEMILGQNKKTSENASNLTKNNVFYVSLTFYLPIPKSLTGGQKNAILWGFKEHNKKPDTSNLIKFYEDAANEILFHDDSMIVEVQGRKEYSDHPRTEITIMSKNQSEENVVQDILSICSPYDFSRLVKDLYEFYDVAKDINRLVGEPNANKLSQDKLDLCAQFLSKISDRNSSIFQKIQKKYPGYWKQNEKVVRFNTIQGEDAC